MSYAERNTRTKKLTGRWVCDAEYKHPDGSVTRWHKAFDSKKEASGAEAYYRATGEYPPTLKLGTKTFRAVAEEFKAKNASWVDAHGVTNSQRLGFCIKVLGDYDVAGVRLRQLDRLVEKVLKHCGVGSNPPSNRTVNYYLDAASKVLRFAHERDMLPMGMPKMPRLANTGNERRPLSEDTEKAVGKALVDSGHIEHAFLIHLLAATGMRMGELYGIEANQVTDDGVTLRPDQTKTKHGRYVPMSPQVAGWLRHLIRGGWMPHRAHLYRIFKETCETLGESKTLTLHCLRHTCVTRLLERGVGKLDVAVIVGHKDKSVTAGYYHPNKEHIKECAYKAHNLLGEFVRRHNTYRSKLVVLSTPMEATTGIEPASTVLQTG